MRIQLVFEWALRGAFASLPIVWVRVSVTILAFHKTAHQYLAVECIIL